MKPETPLVTVIIRCYKPRVEWLWGAIYSALGQNWPGGRPVPLEVILVDDATPQPVAPEFKQHVFGERLRIITGLKRTGPGGAANIAVGEARGEWIALLDQDDFWLPGKLALQLSAAAMATAELKPPAVVFSDCRIVDAAGDPLKEQPPRWAAPVTGPLDFMPFNNPVPLPTALVRREAWLAAGGMSTANWYCCDYGLWLALAARGKRLLYVPGVMACYRRHKGQFSADQQAMYLGVAQAVRTTLELHDAWLDLEDHLRFAAWLSEWEARQ